MLLKLSNLNAANSCKFKTVLYNISSTCLIFQALILCSFHLSSRRSWQFSQKFAILCFSVTSVKMRLHFDGYEALTEIYKIPSVILTCNKRETLLLRRVFASSTAMMHLCDVRTQNPAVHPLPGQMLLPYCSKIKATWNKRNLRSLSLECFYTRYKRHVVQQNIVL